MLSRKQAHIMQYLRLNKAIDLDKACELISDGIYCNARVYVGKTLSRMVNQNHIVRVRPGVFELPKPAYVDKSIPHDDAGVDGFRLT